MISSAVSTQYTSVTDRHRLTAKTRFLRIASRRSRGKTWSTQSIVKIKVAFILNTV